MRRPDFIIAGTQKAGTTWLRDNLYRHPKVSGCRDQIHFFDRHFEKGLSWYSEHFRRFSDEILVGEKTTEYFEPLAASRVSSRIASTCPGAKVVIILRDPVERALSALKHMVISGQEPLPKDPNYTLFADASRPPEERNGYIERGFYASQIGEFCARLADEQILILIFEEDIVEQPWNGLRRTCEFLGVDPAAASVDERPINARRLSEYGIRMMRACRGIPYARSLIWRIDQVTPLDRWSPAITAETIEQLDEMFSSEKRAIYELIGREIPAWTKG